MSGPSIDLEDRNPLGGLDRLVTGIGLAMIAVFPTLAAAIVRPWKLAPLLIADEPDGRSGMILSPGAFFVLSLAVILILVGLLVTPEMVEVNGGLIGPRLALDVAGSAREGDIWKTLSQIAPIFLIALLFGVLGRVLTRWAGSWWDLRVSLRASFYAIAIAICWIILSSLAIDTVGVLHRDWGVTRFLYTVNTAPILALPVWVYFWCFKSGGNLSTTRALVLTAAMAIQVVLFVIISGWVISRL